MAELDTPKPNGHDATVNPEELRTLDVFLDRLRFFRQAGVTFNGDRRLWEAFGYDAVVTARQYRERYARGGVAGRIVDALPNATWRGDVELIEDENPDVSTEFEQQWDDFSSRLKVTSTLCRVDKLSRLSTYAVLLIGTADGNLETELPQGKKQDQILFLTPFAGGGGPGLSERAGIGQDMGSAYVDATIRELDLDPTSDRFGLPKFYQLRRLDAASPLFQKPVHWSRVIHIAENVLDNEVYGQPALERCWNLLDDLDKVTGGGAEAFFLRANPGLHVNVDKDMALTDAANDLTNLSDQIEKWRHKMSDRAFRTKGVDVNMLSSDVANFSQPADAILTQIAGAVSMPKRILTGSEMGELASSQDRDNWKDQINGRQTGHAGPNILRQLADRLITYGYLPTPAQYEVRWAHIQTLTEQEKSAGAKDWASTNQTNGTPIFTEAEIRDKWYGMEPLTPEQLQEIVDTKKIVSPPPLVPPPGQPGTPGDQFPRAAEDIETLRVLRSAIEENNVAVIDAIIGVRHAGGAGSGNFGHEGRPGEIGGSGGVGGGHEGHDHPYSGIGTLLAQRDYLEAYKKSKGLDTPVSKSEAKKLSHVLSVVATAFDDPEIGHLLYQVLGTGGGRIEQVLSELEQDTFHAIGGTGKKKVFPGTSTLDRPRAASSKQEQLDKVRAFIALLKDPDTKGATEWLIAQLVKAGSVEALKQQWKGNE